jgi:hypothetical protein
MTKFKVKVQGWILLYIAGNVGFLPGFLINFLIYLFVFAIYCICIYINELTGCNDKQGIYFIYYGL